MLSLIYLATCAVHEVKTKGATGKVELCYDARWIKIDTMEVYPKNIVRGYQVQTQVYATVKKDIIFQYKITSVTLNGEEILNERQGDMQTLLPGGTI